MADDLVKCLRNRANGIMQWVTVERMATEAADRIERLEAALRKIAEHDMQAIAIDALQPGTRAALGEKKDD